MNNPAFECWAAVYGRDSPRNMWGRNPWECKIDWDAIPEEVRAHEAYASVVDFRDNRGWGDEMSLYGHLIRKIVTDIYTWAVPDDVALEAVSKHGPIVEVGAGRGYWAALLAERGVDVVAYDLNPPTEEKANAWHESPGLFSSVGQADEKVATLHPDRTLFICWAPYGPRSVDRDDTTLGVTGYREAGGSKLIVIGEGDGGCTGGQAFWTELNTHWRQTDEAAVPQWDGIHDSVGIYETSEAAST